MIDFAAAFVSIIFISLLFSPIVLFIYFLSNSKIDVNHDGKDDVPFRWENK
jgi:hypothetical protein